MSDPVHVSSRAEIASYRYTADSFSLGRVSWGAVLAGVALALSIQFLLNLLGLGIGAGIIDPAMSDNPTATSFSVAGGLWFIATGLISAFIGGYIASRLCGQRNKSIGGYHGLTSWAVTTLLALYLLTTSVGAIVGGAFSGFGNLFSGVGQTAISAAAPIVKTADSPFSAIEEQIRSAAGGNDPQALRDAAVAAVQAVVSGDKAQADDARNRAADLLARAQNIPVDQAKADVSKYEEQYKRSVETAKQKATAAAKTAKNVVSAGAILAFIALTLGAIASWLGGFIGTRIDR
ncbi:hypothetical protein MAUB1S_09059 [Mycolicibacterium aubagnense]